MKRFFSVILLLSILTAIISPVGGKLYSVDEVYNLSEVYRPGSVEVEEKRKVCIFPFRNRAYKDKPDAKTNPSVDYLSRGIPAILVTEVRKMGMVYDDNFIPEVIRYPMGKKPKDYKPKKKDTTRTLEGGGLGSKEKRKLEYSEEELNRILAGKEDTKPVTDPRYIPIEVDFYRDLTVTPEREESFALGSSRKCFYVITGEYEKTGTDSLVSRYELTNLWDGSYKTGSHNTSFIRAFQELDPLAEKIRKDLMGKDISSLSVDTGSRSGALVFVDEVYIGKTPIKNHPITLGKHEILVTEKDFEEIREILEVGKFPPPKRTYTLKPIPRVAYISVDSNPPGAEVYLGIEKLGVTPLKKVSVPVGKNRLRVSKEEHIDYFTGVDLKEKTNHKYQVDLRPGDSDIYYKNRDYVFLDYTYKDFSTYFLWSSLLFYAGHAYLQIQANRLEDSIRPQINFVNFESFQAVNNNDPNAAIALLAYDQYVIGQVEGDIKRYRRLAGDFGLERGTQAQFRDGPMIYGMVFSLVASFTFLFLGLDRETIDIGFHPHLPTRDLAGERGGFESKGHIRYNFRF